MPSCVFKHCKSCSQKLKKEDGISFHRLPTDDDLRDDWISIIRHSRQDENWQPSKFCVVCSLHFQEDDVYFTENGRRLLIKTSTPTKNLSTPAIAEVLLDPITLEGPEADPSNYLQIKLEEPVININEVSGMSTQDNFKEPKIQVNEVSGKTFQDNFEESEISDSEIDVTIFDTPTERRLRKDLKKHKLLYRTTKMKLKTLQQNIRRLKKRNTSLKNMLKELKEKK